MSGKPVSREDVAQMNRSGLRDVEIAAALGCTTRTVYAIRMDLGLPRVLRRAAPRSRGGLKSHRTTPDPTAPGTAADVALLELAAKSLELLAEWATRDYILRNLVANDLSGMAAALRALAARLAAEPRYTVGLNGVTYRVHCDVALMPPDPNIHCEECHSEWQAANHARLATAPAEPPTWAQHGLALACLELGEALGIPDTTPWPEALERARAMRAATTRAALRELPYDPEADARWDRIAAEVYPCATGVSIAPAEPPWLDAPDGVGEWEGHKPGYVAEDLVVTSAFDRLYVRSAEKPGDDDLPMLSWRITRPGWRYRRRTPVIVPPREVTP